MEAASAKKHSFWLLQLKELEIPAWWELKQWK